MENFQWGIRVALGCPEGREAEGYAKEITRSRVDPEILARFVDPILSLPDRGPDGRPAVSVYTTVIAPSSWEATSLVGDTLRAILNKNFLDMFECRATRVFS
jgi:hypothetical protein